MASPLTPRAKDFPRWYQDVVAHAELADNGPVRGTMVIRPWGYAIWERLQAELDARIKAAGADNAYFPLFIPESYLRREAEHVEGFSPELAVVTHGGGRDLDEPVVVRPTSETVINSFFAKWIQSWRDLPLCINQWSNVVRWELRPRILLRTTEFLWQEGHTAHVSEADARAYALRILTDVYASTMVDVMAAPVLTGHKTARERFAGAIRTWTCESMMGDGKALQMGTSHELGQNFARAFGIQYTSEAGVLEHAWQTSWGASTRLIGALVMMHGDDAGLRLPPALAPVQVVVVLVRDEGGARKAAEALVEDLKRAGHRVRLDDRVDVSFGRRAVEWELKGVPVRVEVGPRDLESGQVTIVRRDHSPGPERPGAGGARSGVPGPERPGAGGARSGETPPAKRQVPVAAAAQAVTADLAEAHGALLAEATRFRDDRTVEVSSVDEAADAAAEGFATVPWDAVGLDGELQLAHAGVTVRCLRRPDGSLAEADDEPGLLAVVARAY